MDTSQSTLRELIDLFQRMPLERQAELLGMARRLAPSEPQSVTDLAAYVISGADLLRRAREIQWPTEDLAQIAAAIEDHEVIDWDEWDLPAGHGSGDFSRQS